MINQVIFGDLLTRQLLISVNREHLAGFRIPVQAERAHYCSAWSNHEKEDNSAILSHFPQDGGFSFFR